jgi:predicted DNA-binding transcriptional regulator AlpA
MAEVIWFPGGQRGPRRIISTKELQKELGKSARWIGYRLKEGMPRVSWGPRTNRFDLEAVQAWLRERYPPGA